jgi:hypothetical protein
MISGQITQARKTSSSMKMNTKKLYIRKPPIGGFLIIS